MGQKRRVKAGVDLRNRILFCLNMWRKHKILLDAMAADIGYESLQSMSDQEALPRYRRSVEPISENQ